jgi:hypothetical protein
LTAQVLSLAGSPAYSVHMKTHKRLHALTGILIISALLPGCGGQSSESSESAQSSTSGESAPSSTSMNSDFTFMSDFLAALESNGIDCIGYKQDEEVIGVREQGTCTYGTAELTLDIFADAKTALTMIDALKAFGGYWVVSGNWAIVVDDGDVAKDLQMKLGARIA